MSRKKPEPLEPNFADLYGGGDNLPAVVAGSWQPGNSALERAQWALECYTFVCSGKPEDVRNGHPYSDGKHTFFNKDRLFEVIAEDYPEMVADWSVRYREKLLRQLSVFPALLRAVDERGRTGNLRCVRVPTQRGALLEMEFLSPDEEKAEWEHEKRVQELTDEQVEAIKGALEESKSMPSGPAISSFAEGIKWLDEGRPLLMPPATPEVRRLEQIDAARVASAQARALKAERARVRRENAKRADQAKRIAQLEAMHSYSAPAGQDDEDAPPIPT